MFVTTVQFSNWFCETVYDDGIDTFVPNLHYRLDGYKNKIQLNIRQTICIQRTNGRKPSGTQYQQFLDGKFNQL